MDVILQLGGNPARTQTTIDLAKAYPNAKIVLSTCGATCLSILEAADINRERIVINDEAWDTITNLTHTYKDLKRLKCTRLYVVTDMFHTYRSSFITAAVWCGRIPYYMVPHGFVENAKDESYAFGQFFTTLLWRLTGILIYSKRLKDKRKSMITHKEKHSLLEIGI